MGDAVTRPPDEEQPDDPAAEEGVDLPDLEQLVAWFEQWEEETLDEQELARRDRRYYDGQQWTDDEISALNERGQPVITINLLARKLNFILGEEVVKRVDPSARPRTPQHEDSAQAATDALRYVEETEDFDDLQSEVADENFVEGRGVAMVTIEDDEEYGRCVKLVHVPWDRYFHDPKSRKRDYSDAKFQGVVNWMDLEDAILDFPEDEDELREAVGSDHYTARDTTDDKPRRWVDGKRKRVKVVEIYFTAGRKKNCYRAAFTKGKILGEGVAPSGYLNEKKTRHVCPLVATSCYINRETNARYGVLRNLISPQDEVNKFHSKAMHGLNVRQVIAERDFIRQPTEFMQEIAKPDGFAEVEPNGLMEKRVMVNTASDMAQANLGLLEEAKSQIASVGPSTDTLASLPGEASGRAVIARKQAASQELGRAFDAIRMWRLRMYRKIWLAVRQAWPEEKWLRVTDDAELRGFRFVALNQQMPRAQRLQELMEKGSPFQKALQSAAGNEAPRILADAQRAAQSAGPQQDPKQGEQMIQALVMQHPLMAEMVTLNQVDQLDVDILVDDVPDTGILADEQFDKLMTLAPSMAAAGVPLDAELLIEASSLPDKRKLREIVSKKKQPSPQAQEMQKLQQQVAKLEAAHLQAQVQKTSADAQLSQARAQTEIASLGQQQAPVPPSPLEHAKAERESVNTRLDIERTGAQVERDRAAAHKSHTDAALATHQAMQPVMALEIE